MGQVPAQEKGIDATDLGKVKKLLPLVEGRIKHELPELDKLYKHLYANPELSLEEEQTAARMTKELESLGFKVTTKVGGHGIVGIFENGKGPTILIRTPYGKGSDLLPAYQAFVDRGYSVVMQDVRGRYASEGVFDALTAEGRDGSDTLDWIAAQPWSDGKVGMVGGS